MVTLHLLHVVLSGGGRRLQLREVQECIAVECDLLPATSLHAPPHREHSLRAGGTGQIACVDGYLIDRVRVTQHRDNCGRLARWSRGRHRCSDRSRPHIHDRSLRAQADGRPARVRWCCIPARFSNAMTQVINENGIRYPEHICPSHIGGMTADGVGSATRRYHWYALPRVQDPHAER